jgi:alkyl sulfatase BDS1-like metallo-beta-lactamase superfamily hydrolase
MCWGSPQWSEGRRQAYRAQLEFYRYRRDFVLTLENCALTYIAGAQAAAADASFTLSRGTLDEVIAKQTIVPEAVAGGKIKVTGNAMRLAELMALMDEFPRMFEIVEPKRAAVS